RRCSCEINIRTPAYTATKKKNVTPASSRTAAVLRMNEYVVASTIPAVAATAGSNRNRAIAYTIPTHPIPNSTDTNFAENVEYPITLNTTAINQNCNGGL